MTSSPEEGLRRLGGARAPMDEDEAAAFGSEEGSDGASQRLTGTSLSKRAARRLIQRAFVLLGRDRYIRQHLRQADFVSLWVLEDWNFSWTVEMRRGKIRYERRPAKHPDVTLTWRTAEVFFRQVEAEATAEGDFEITGSRESRKAVEPVCRALARILSGVIRNPFDDDGTRLA